jgi:hypothetical protein
MVQQQKFGTKCMFIWQPCLVIWVIWQLLPEKG